MRLSLAAALTFEIFLNTSLNKEVPKLQFGKQAMINKGHIITSNQHKEHALPSAPDH